jgi:hypothetical protein
MWRANYYYYYYYYYHHRRRHHHHHHRSNLDRPTEVFSSLPTFVILYEIAYFIVHEERHYLRTALFGVITHRVVVIPYRRFWTTHRFHSQSWTLKMRPIGCPETSVNYHYLLRNDSEERSLRLLCRGNLKSRKALPWLYFVSIYNTFKKYFSWMLKIEVKYLLSSVSTYKEVIKV